MTRRMAPEVARAKLDRDPSRTAALLARAWWPPHSNATQLPLADVQRACRAFLQVEADWRALAIGGRLCFRWSLRRNPPRPGNPPRLAMAAKPPGRRAARGPPPPGPKAV